MAAFYGQRLLSRLHAGQLAHPRLAFLASAPEGSKPVLGRNEPKKKRWKEKTLKHHFNFLDVNSSWEERLSSVATPLCGLPYEEQLKVKYEKMKSVLQTLTARLKELGADPFMITQVPDEICCPLEPVIPSPIVNGYRNKSTFSVNHGPDGNPKTVGLYVGTGKGRNIVCVQANHLLNMPRAHLQVAQYYEEFLRQSPLDPCLQFHMGGHWRELTIRTNRKGDKMAIVTFHPQLLNPEELSHQKELVRNFFTCGPGAVCGLASLYFQERCNCSLSLADRVSRVIGVEVVNQAVEDARWNAAFNGVSNCEFHSGKAEVVLPQLLMSLPETRPLTAVVNPSRAGLRKTPFLFQIRSGAKLQSIFRSWEFFSSI